MLLLGLLAVAACTSKTKVPEPAVAEHGRSVEGPTAELLAIDSLLWHQPDSALTCLLPCFDTCIDTKFCVSTATAYNRHYAHLLLSELLYKNDYAQVNRTELLQAVDYFDSITQVPEPAVAEHGRRVEGPSNRIAFLDARAHYINGVGYYENDSVVEACAEYLKTLEVMEEHFEDKDLVGHKARFMAYTYNRLGDMFEEQLLAEPAIVCYKQALFYCRRNPTSIYGIPVLFYNLGIQYDLANQKDSAAFYYDKALANIPDYDNIHYRDIITSKSVLAFNLGFCVDSVIKDLKYVISLTSDDIERTYRFLNLGNILFESKLYDSSRFYLETVFEQQEDIQSKILAAENLSSIYQMEGDSIKSQKYTSFLAGFTMSEIEKKKDVSKINEMFKNYLTQKQEKRAEEEREKAIKRVIRIVIPIAVAVALVIFVLAKLRGKKQLRDKEKHHQREMESERQAHKMQQAALSGRLKRSNEELRELKGQLGQRKDATTTAEQAASFTDEPICRLIMERVNEGQFKSKVDYVYYKDYALDKQQLLDLRLAADRHFGQFTVRLKKAYPELTNSDLDYCCLYLLGLTDADIAALMQRAYNTVIERNGKLKKVFGKENTLSVTLKAIANGFTSV